MSRLKEIFTGFKNLVLGDPKIKEIARIRMEVCAGCEHASKTVYLHCDLCGCYIPAKARSPISRCPADLWPEIKAE